MDVAITGHLARRVADLVSTAVDLPASNATLAEHGRAILGDLGEHMHAPRRGPSATGHHVDPVGDAVTLDEAEATRLAGYLDLLGGAPDVPPVMRDDASDAAAQLWATLKAALGAGSGRTTPPGSAPSSASGGPASRRPASRPAARGTPGARTIDLDTEQDAAGAAPPQR